MTAKRAITRADVLDMAAYAAIRAEKRRALMEIKARRRVALGPHATLHFESYDTLWLQIHEMLRIEKSEDARIAGELAAYGPLVPSGRELVATVMFELDHPERRHRLLSALGGVEHCFRLAVAGEESSGIPESDSGRTDDRGKTSAVHFIRFPLTPSQITGFRTPAVQVTIGTTHPGYGHLAILPETTRAELATDLD